MSEQVNQPSTKQTVQNLSSQIVTNFQNHLGILQKVVSVEEEYWIGKDAKTTWGHISKINLVLSSFRGCDRILRLIGIIYYCCHKGLMFDYDNIVAIFKSRKQDERTKKEILDVRILAYTAYEGMLVECKTCIDCTHDAPELQKHFPAINVTKKHIDTNLCLIQDAIKKVKATIKKL